MSQKLTKLHSVLTIQEHIDARLWNLGLSKRWRLGFVELIRTKNKKIKCFGNVGFILN